MKEPTYLKIKYIQKSSMPKLKAALIVFIKKDSRNNFWLWFGLANRINDYLRLKPCVVFGGNF